MRNLHLIFAAAGLACASVGYASNVQKSEQKKAPAAVDLRAALSFSENWEETPFPYGIYTAPLAEGSTPEFVFLTDDRNMEGGAVYVDGVIHSISKLGKWLWDEEDEGWYFNQTGAAYTSFDAETGEVLYDKTEGVSTDLFTSDMCYDHTTGNIYGVFKVNGYKNAWGILDVDNLQVEYINQNMSSGMSAIATDKEGQIWGVTSNGNLVKINKETGDVSEPLAQYSMYNGYKSTGVIDPQTNTFYWLLHSYGSPGIYAIDLNSYELTKLNTCRGYERWGGAYIATVTVDEGTPAAPTNLSVSFPGGALTGSVSFDAPALSSDDEDISGTTLKYVIKCDEEVVAQGSVKAGERAVSNNFTVTGGYHNINVVLSNDKGEGIPANLSYWFGNDAPSNVNDITISNDKYTINLSWTAPAVALHNGYFVPEEVTYKVTRMPDNVVVADNLTAAQFTDVIESKKVTKYYYTIVPVFAGQEGKAADSPKVLIGEGVNLPYETIFSDEDCELMTVEDTNGDGNTWDIGDETAIYRFGDVDADDWLFTAPFYLEAGTAYCLTSQIQSGLSRLEKFEIKLGSAPKSQTMTQSVVAPVEFEGQYYDVEEYFSVPETGTYFIGFHALCPESHFSMVINYIKLEVRMSDEAPAAGEVKAEAGEKGQLSATLNITAPVKNFKGDDLTGLEGVNIFHNGNFIDSMDEIEPGKTYTFTHTNSQQGFNTYSVVFVNEHGNGLQSEVKVFVGKDVPLPPKNVHFEFEGDNAVLRWDAPGERGVNGGYVDPAAVVYSPTYVHKGEWVILDETSDTEVSVPYDTTGAQRWFLFGLMAATDEGTSDAVYSNYMITGDKYSMPYLESLDHGHNNTFIGSSDPFSQVGGYGSDTEKSATEIGGCLRFRPYAFLYEPPYVDTMTTGVINTAGYNDVTLSFSYYNDAEENAGVELAASLYDQDNDITYNLGTVKLDASASEWRKFEANKKINSDNLRIHVKITSNNGNNIYLDEFRLDGVSSVDTILANGVSVSAENGAIRVAGLEGENVMICNLSGVLLYNDKSEGDITVPVVAGIYVVRVADRSLKVVVR